MQQLLASRTCAPALALYFASRLVACRISNQHPVCLAYKLEAPASPTQPAGGYASFLTSLYLSLGLCPAQLMFLTGTPREFSFCSSLFFSFFFITSFSSSSQPLTPTLC